MSPPRVPAALCRQRRTESHLAGTTTRSRRASGTDQWAASFHVLIERRADGSQRLEASGIKQITV